MNELDNSEQGDGDQTAQRGREWGWGDQTTQLLEGGWESNGPLRGGKGQR